MLSAKNISFSVGTKQIVQEVSANFLPGKFTMILGPNGSGKSSFLKIFAGEIPASSGEVYYDGESLQKIEKIALAKRRAVMSQQPELSFPLTVEEVVMMGRYPHFNFNPNEKDKDICRLALEKLQLGSFSARNYLTLSGGEKQRVQYARVLAQIWEPPVNGCRYLFLDEPLNSLDINYQQEFLKIAVSLLDAQTVLIAVMHDINLALQYADELICLKEGKLIASGHTADVITEKLIYQMYAVEARIVNYGENGQRVVVF